VTDLYYLSFRDISAPASTGVTAGEVYVQRNMSAQFDWQAAALGGKDWVAWDQVLPVFQGKRVCFVLHGFNVPLEAGVQSCGPAAQCYASMGAPALGMINADVVVTVLWPGDGFIFWSFMTATTHTKAVGANFANFLASSAFQAREVSFISHSLGARVILETVSQTLAKGRSAQAPVFGTAILMAPAVDNDALDTPYASATGPGGLKRIVVLSSPTDTVLSRWFVLGDVADRLLFQGYKGNTKALGLVGPVFAAGSTAQPLTEWYEIGGGQNHGDYLPDGSQLPDKVWGPRPTNVGEACQDVVDLTPFLPILRGWGTDRTGQFRGGWTPRL
jgi:Alpha/beta hydrolase of unknown function (DUF900)